jgi:hypothetical protein
MGFLRYWVAVGVVGALVFSAQSIAAGSRLMQASASFQRLGDYWISDDPSYSGAIEALGAPSSCHLVDSTPSHVTASWRPLGVRMDLVTFGGVPAGKTGCTAPASIQVSTVRVTGKKWFTSLKLRVGDPVTKLQRLYPRASPTKGVRGWYRKGYWLVTRRGICLGDCGGARYTTVPVLVAETTAGRVSSIVFVVGAQGE